MNDKQVKDLYNAVLREVISTIRDDPLIMNMGVQSNVIDALEEVVPWLISEVEKESCCSKGRPEPNFRRAW